MQTKFPQPQPLISNLQTEFLVIGGGIAGLSVAYELAHAGREVVVIDRGSIGGGMTARTSAHLSYEIDDFYFELIKVRGARKAKLYLESQRAALDRIEKICAYERIACDFARIDLFCFSPDRNGHKLLKKEYEAVTQLGFVGVEWADAPVAGEAHGCLRFRDQARFHPRRYLAGLSNAIKRYGGKFYSRTPIISVKENAKGAIATSADGHSIGAKAIIAATNTPFVNRLAIHTKQVPYRSYVLTLEIPNGLATDALIWDTEHPYHYVRLYTEKGKTLLIVGGEDHKTGTADDAEARFKRLQAWARERFPQCGHVRDKWSGQVYEPVDYLPFIGRSPGHKNVFLVTGDSGEGLTTGVAASLILPDLIAGRRNDWAKVYSPSRKIVQPSPIVTYAKDLAGASKHLAKNLLGREAKSDEIPPGKGAIISISGQKAAAYRDERGILHLRSAACTHAGCVVQWNSFERCWDCPCHGSQFAATGDVLQGPATKSLGPIRSGD
jgi:glycine/D-amino acid oxidase-like deaminating enzyme/nitrite reductase/ring-hydroxylating ferredoxin subunit